MTVHALSYHSYTGNKVKGNLEGPGTVEFKDGHTYEVDLYMIPGFKYYELLHTHMHMHIHTGTAPLILSL